MARQANGNYLQPANTAAVSGQTISSTAFNTLITDVGTEITNSVDRGGRSAMTAALPMGGQKITGMADPTTATDGATKNYVDTVTGSFFSTGDVKLTLKTVADSGWIMAADATLGNTGSSGNFVGPGVQALFTLLWNNVADTWAPVSGGRGVSAAADWAGLKTIALTRVYGRALAIAGSGSGLSVRALGQTLGAETATLLTGNLPPYTPSGTITNGAISTTSNASGLTAGTAISAGGGGSITTTGQTITSTQAASTFTGAPQGGSSAPVAIMQPTVFLNAMIKL